VRTIRGHADRIVIVGAGLGGLSAALRLAGAGREVVVLERAHSVGGRAGRLDLDGYTFDTGPSVLTMPSLLADALACVDEHLDDWLDLRPVDPAYRAFFPDGSHVDVIADVDRMTEQVRRVCGSRDAEGYRRFAAWSKRLFELERHAFMDRNLDSPLDLLVPQLAGLIAAGGFGRMATQVARFVNDPRLRRVLSFQALYAGLSPYNALAIYSAITYLDTVAGVCFPVGGMHAVPAALAGAAEKHGVTMRLGVEVTEVERRGDRVVAVRTGDGEHITGDAFVINADLAAAWKLLGLPPRALHWSPSCVLLLAGVEAHYGGIAHHNLHFGRRWREPLHELTHGRLMTDPSYLVSAPTVTDPSLAPPNRSLLSALMLVPNLESGYDWTRIGPRVRDELVARMETAGYIGFGDAIEVEHVTTPADWARQGFAAGTPFSASQRFRQSGPFRPRNLVLDNVVLAGCGTHPGIGIPTTVMSGRLAAERLLGAGVR
jgi:phytoene desaturase